MESWKYTIGVVVVISNLLSMQQLLLMNQMKWKNNEQSSKLVEMSEDDFKVLSKKSLKYPIYG